MTAQQAALKAAHAELKHLEGLPEEPEELLAEHHDAWRSTISEPDAKSEDQEFADSYNSVVSDECRWSLHGIAERVETTYHVLHLLECNNYDREIADMGERLRQQSRSGQVLGTALGVLDSIGGSSKLDVWSAALLWRARLHVVTALPSKGQGARTDLLPPEAQVKIDGIAPRTLRRWRKVLRRFNRHRFHAVARIFIEQGVVMTAEALLALGDGPPKKPEGELHTWHAEGDPTPETAQGIFAEMERYRPSPNAIVAHDHTWRADTDGVAIHDGMATCVLRWVIPKDEEQPKEAEQE